MKPVRFRRPKTQEFLAYLVDARGMCSSQQIMVGLWEEEKSSSYIRSLRKDLLDTFAAKGCEDIFIIQWDKLGFDMDRVYCLLFLLTIYNPSEYFSVISVGSSKC